MDLDSACARVVGVLKQFAKDCGEKAWSVGMTTEVDWTKCRTGEFSRVASEDLVDQSALVDFHGLVSIVVILWP